ncbi:hypothetical protein LBMAG53_21110 [Planctomycetota bacterium]|nr:hypothetical protein LBMAG53_21110 [Planctomycetota bacterium]
MSVRSAVPGSTFLAAALAAAPLTIAAAAVIGSHVVAGDAPAAAETLAPAGSGLVVVASLSDPLVIWRLHPVPSAGVRLLFSEADLARIGLDQARELADRCSLTLARLRELTGLVPGAVQSTVDLAIVPEVAGLANTLPRDHDGLGRVGSAGIELRPHLLDLALSDPARWDAAVAHELAHNADVVAGTRFSSRWFVGPEPAHAWTAFVEGYLLPVFAREGDRTEGLPPESALAGAARRRQAGWAALGRPWSAIAGSEPGAAEPESLSADAQGGLLLELAGLVGADVVRRACALARAEHSADGDAGKVAALANHWSLALGADLSPWLIAHGWPVPAATAAELAQLPAWSPSVIASDDQAIACFGPGAWQLDLDEPTRLRIEVRSPPGGFAGWLTLDAGTWTARRWCLPGADTALTALLPAGLPLVTAREDGNLGTWLGAPCAVHIAPAPLWPPATPAPGLWQLRRDVVIASAPAVPSELAGRSDLTTRWWSSERGWVGTSLVVGGVAAPFALVTGGEATRIRVQWYADGLPAWPISAASIVPDSEPVAPVGVN